MNRRPSNPFAIPAPIIPLRVLPDSYESDARRGIRETQEAAELALEHWALSPPDDLSQVTAMERIRDRCAYVLAKPTPEDQLTHHVVRSGE